MPFPASVNTGVALGVEGDFASQNPYSSVPTADGAFIAGDSGLIVGRFAWPNAVNSRKLDNAGSGAPLGFVARGGLQATITSFLAENSMTILAGKEVTAYSEGDFLVRNSGAGAVTHNMKAFASNTTGLVQFAAAGASIAGHTETKWYAKVAGMDAPAAGELVMISNRQ